MILKIIYLLLPFLTAPPAFIAFIKWRGVKFRNLLCAIEFLGFFSFFLFNFIFAYQYFYKDVSYTYLIKIIDLFFLLFVIQMDLSYSINKKRFFKILSLVALNAVLQILCNDFLHNVYGIELWNVIALLFSVYVAGCIGREYYLAAYIPKMSIYAFILLVIPCLLFDFYPFRIFFVSFVFYLTMRKRQNEIASIQKDVKRLQNEQINFQNMINEISKSIKDFSNKEEASNSYLASICHLLDIKGAAIYEWNESKKYFSCIAAVGLYFPLSIGSEKLFTRADLLRELTLKQQIRDPESVIWKCGHNNSAGAFFNNSQHNMEKIFGKLSQEISSIILIPLLQEDELLGVLSLENKKIGDYLTETDFNIAKNFSNFATIILNSSRIAMQKNENIRMSLELNSGNAMQAALFSHDIPQVAGIRINFFMHPAKEIGGDYYDFIKNGNKMGVAIGDVSGKGVSAGILAAIMQTYLQTKYEYAKDLKKLIIDLNTYMSRKVSTGMFITMLFFEWNSEDRKLRYVSCGHEHILHFKAHGKTMKCIRSGGLALMMDSDIEPYIEECELKIEEGDAVLLYTDGVTETFSPKKEIFGLERLIKFFEGKPINSELIEKLLPQTLDAWRGDGVQTDDITCVLMRF
ncbi:MAG: SpoIIE family protein phosphatase [Fibromonadaceae bacterium]|jgi:serine phosphatase RsbU (regulator of sigma subunit)|nr:SpoIIE family protein phosphatase [Fibromonadaceae bacterium]